MSMNQEVKKAWVEALSKGHYAQGTEYLHEGNNFCAMGVLCDLFIQKHEGLFWWDEIDRTEEDNPRYAIAGGASSSARDQVMPMEVADWAGLHHSLGAFSEDYAEEVIHIIMEEGESIHEDTIRELAHNDDLGLTSLNDKGVSFPALARIIEIVF